MKTCSRWWFIWVSAKPNNKIESIAQKLWEWKQDEKQCVLIRLLTSIASPTSQVANSHRRRVADEIRKEETENTRMNNFLFVVWLLVDGKTFNESEKKGGEKIINKNQNKSETKSCQSLETKNCRCMCSAAFGIFSHAISCIIQSVGFISFISCLGVLCSLLSPWPLPIVAILPVCTMYMLGLFDSSDLESLFRRLFGFRFFLYGKNRNTYSCRV